MIIYVTGELLWYERNKTPSDMLSLENNREGKNNFAYALGHLETSHPCSIIYNRMPISVLSLLMKI